MHLAYCHKIASIYGPITLISLAKNLDQALEDDQLIDQVIIFDKNKKITDIPKISSNLRKLNLDCIFIFYPSARLYLAAKLAGIKKVYCYPLFKKKELHLVEAAKKIKNELQKIGLGRVIFENTGNIGKSYRKHDEIGTPNCITIDYDSLEKKTVTLRDRDTMDQKTIDIDDISKHLLL